MKRIFPADSAIVVVDEIYDFIDGSMACQGADACVKNSAALLGEACGQGADCPIIFVRDSHPANHCSFSAQGGPWPPHCVQGTRGAEVAEELLPFMQDELTFCKGTDPAAEQYSGFEGRNEAGQTMGEVLSLLGTENVFIIGIATEYCVRNTAEDLLKAGYRVTVLKDCLAWVDSDGHARALEEMTAEGIRIM